MHRQTPQQKVALVGITAGLLGFLVHAGFGLGQGGGGAWVAAGLWLFAGAVWWMVYRRALWGGLIQTAGMLSHAALAVGLFYDHSQGGQVAFHIWLRQFSDNCYHLYLLQLSLYAILLALYFIERYVDKRRRNV